jgi:mediator of RNA polymerase II transcription subunit 17
MIFRRRALASLSEYQGEGTNEIVFPSRQNTRIQISLRTTLPNGQESISTNTYEPHTEEASVKKELARAQTEIIDQEIFSHLVKEATALPTILPRVSERSIAIDAGEGIEIKFELVRHPYPLFFQALKQNLWPVAKG